MRKKDAAIIKQFCQRIHESNTIMQSHLKELESRGEWHVGNLYFDAVSMQLEVITEYVCKLLDHTGEFGRQLPLVYPHIAWSQIHRFRQLLAHWYLDKISAEDARAIIQGALPDLMLVIQAILSAEK